MKTLTTIIISVLFVQVKGYLIKVPIKSSITHIEPDGWVHIQKLLMPLFENVCEESSDPVVVRLSEEFLNCGSASFVKSGVFEKLHEFILSKSLLKKGEIFTELNKEHFSELQIVTDVLLHAKDFDTFYTAACWARQNLNCGLFVDAIYFAIINRRDTERLYLPPLFEVLPNYFIQKDYMLKASSLINGEEVSNLDGVRIEGNSYIIDANYTTDLYDDTNDMLNYFHEDVGLNTYYYLIKLNSLQWYQNSDSKQDTKWGQYLYSNIKKLVNRYNLERYSNGLSELEPINWDNINELLYDSKLIYSNGNEFFQRFTVNTNDPILTALKNIENNITTIVTTMRDEGYEKSDILNCLMKILYVSETSYENLALQVLSNMGTATGSYSVLSHYMTTLRDPIFWKLSKHIVDIVDTALKVLPTYTKNQLYFPGVEITNIDVKKLSTNFDNFEFDVTDALKTHKSNLNFQLKINQNRLNIKPFSIKIGISSLVAQKGLIKIYIGPKILPGEFIDKKNLFMLLDCFEVNIKIGSNLITRTLNDINNLSEDFTSLKTIQKRVLDAEFGINMIPLHLIKSQINFPSRLVLPKGTNEGLPLQMFVFVAPFVKTTIVGSQNNIGAKVNAILSPGYPLDLNMDNENNILLNLPNALFKDVIITHKSGIKTTNYYGVEKNDKDWQDGYTDKEYPKYYEQSSKPKYNKKTIDYKSKLNKGENKETIQTLDEDKQIYENKQNNINSNINEEIQSPSTASVLQDHNIENYVDAFIFKNSDVDDDRDTTSFNREQSDKENQINTETVNNVVDDHYDIESNLIYADIEKGLNADPYDTLNKNSNFSHSDEIFESDKSNEEVQEFYKSPNLLTHRKLFPKIYNIIIKPKSPKTEPESKQIVYV